MITKKELESLEKLKLEQKDLFERIEKLESMPQAIVQDSVKGSSREFPFTQHNCIVKGFEEDKVFKRRKNLIKKLKKRYKQNEEDILKSIVHIEYELKKIEDSEIRKIIRYRYEDDLNYIQIAHKLNDKEGKIYTADSIRMKLNRFFEK